MILRINNQTFDIPESWNELTLEQQYTAHHIIFIEKYELLTAEEKLSYLKIELFKLLTGLPHEFLIDLKADVDKNEEEKIEAFYIELNHLLSITDFFFKKTEKGIIPILGLTKNPYPQLGKGAEKLFGPKDELDNISIYEMSYLYTAHENYITTKEDKYLDELIATMYRPAKPSTKENIASSYEGDIRFPLHKYEDTIEKRVKIVSTLPIRTKKLILFFFESCREAIADAYPYVFTKSEKKSDMTDYSWAGVIFDLAGSLDKIATIQEMNHATVLLFKNKQNEEAIYANLRNAIT